MTHADDLSTQIWDVVGPVYLRRQQPSSNEVSYGLWSPPESELRLLGEVAGLRVLDLGCGGGHNAVALARRGAQVTGVDGSGTLLAGARALASQAGAAVDFHQRTAAQLDDFTDAGWELMLSVATLHYVDDVEPVMRTCARLLAPGGRLVVSVDHPMRNCFFDDEDEELTITPVRDYHPASIMRWTFPETETRLQTVHRPVSAWCDLMTAAGLRLCRLVEPPAPRDVLDATWPADGALAPLRHVPQVLIIVAEKPPAQPTE
jgi:SAM-dependent methyltransferase